MHKFDYFWRNIIDRKNGGALPGMRGSTGHAPDNTCFFILRDHGAAGARDHTNSERTIDAHAGKHDAQQPRPESRRRRTEKRIDRRLAEMYRRAVVEHDMRGARFALDLHVLA